MDGIRRNLQDAGAKWPTPAARDYRHPNAKSYQECGGGLKGEQLPNAVGGQLNPTWVEWLLGLPTGWTACGPSEMEWCLWWWRMRSALSALDA